MLQAWMHSLQRPPEQLTLVFDQGNTSKRNLKQLVDCRLHWVGAIPARWLPDLLEVSLQRYEKLCLPPTKHLRTYRCRRLLWNREVTLVVVFSPSLYVKQRAAQNRLQAKVEQQLRELAEAIRNWNRSRRGQGHREESVRRKIRQWTRRDHLKEFLEIELETEDERVTRLDWRWNRSQKRAVQRRYFGKTLLFTDHDQWDTGSIVKAYRKLYRNEHLFRLSKGRQGPWWPMYHWTDSKVRVHALYCYLALLLLSILQLKLREANLSLSVQRALQQLESIEEALVLYRNRKVDRVLSDMSCEQRTLAGSIGLLDLAEKMGTTVLEPS
jgi:transposase